MATYARYNLVLQDEAGDVVDGASVSVQNENTLAFPQLYSDRNGATSLGNPFTAASGADAGFHIGGGVYKIVATLGGFSRTLRYVGIGKTAETEYETGFWTPIINVATPGNLSTAYTFQNGTFTRIGNVVFAFYDVLASTFSHTTASGQASIADSGSTLPSSALAECTGTLIYQGITKANYTTFHTVTGVGVGFAIECSGSGQNVASLQVSDLPSTGAGGAAKLFRGTCVFITS